MNRCTVEHLTFTR